MDTDVVIVGAGPTGLMLAGELRLGGARVTVLERLSRPTGQSRGLGFTARAMEVFDQRGLLPDFGNPQTSPVGHFGGLQFDYSVLPDSHFGARGIPQSRTEEVLEAWARRLGADVRRGCEVLGFTERPDGVRVSVSAPDGLTTVTAAYLVGCDGGQSMVRTTAGFAFPGTPATRRMYLADVVGAAIRPRFLGERRPNGMVMAAPLGEGLDRIIVCEHGTPPGDRNDPVDYAEVARAWERITGESLAGTTATWVSSFTDATRQATEYRRGRVLLAGDAAHIHLPAGGQGLSTGVQDAANLGWKLAAVVQGWAPDGLLDTYHGERHPAGARLLTNTKAQQMIFLGGSESEPLRSLLGDLLTSDQLRRHLSGMVSGLDVRYDVTPDGPGPDSGALDSGGSLVGRRLPPRPLLGADGPGSTTRLLHAGQGVLLDLADDAELRRAAAPWKDRVLTATAAPQQPDALHGARALLVRPDGYVVWAAGRDEAPGDPTPALRRWFGSPTEG